MGVSNTEEWGCLSFLIVLFGVSYGAVGSETYASTEDRLGVPGLML
jgi:hypothetical protein